MKHWGQGLVSIIQYYSIYVSATVLRVDLEKRQLKKPNRFISVYVIIGNISLLCWLPHAVQLNLSHSQLYVANPVAVYANYATIISRLVVMAMYVLTRSKRDRDLEKWLQDILQIQTAYFDRFKDIPKDTTHRKWLYLNSAITCIHTLTMAASMNRAAFSGDFLPALDTYPLFGMVAVQHLYMLHHAALLCYLRECLSVLNQQLCLNRLDPKLSLIYFQIRSMMQRLNVIYSPMILFIQLSLIVSNSMVGYIGCLMLLFPEENFSIYSYLFGSALYLWLLVHMNSYFMICDWVAATAKQTDVILFEYTTCESIEQEIEMVAFARSLHGAHINIAGMFDINLSTLFSIIAQTQLYTIILLQTDYGNALK